MKIENFNRPETDENGYTLVTPELASKWLSQNIQNRQVRPSAVMSLTKKILSGQWEPDIPDHIAFYEDGTLANGQHRLLAIERANISVKTKVDYDIPKSAAICIDTGKSRTFSDNVKILTGETFYTKKLSNVMRACFAGGSKLTHEDHLKIANRYKGQILTLIELFSKSKSFVSSTNMMAAVFLAYMSGVDYDTLYKFIEILNSGRAYYDKDETVIMLRDKLLFETNGRRKSSGVYQSDIKKYENVIYNYDHGKYLKQIKAVETFRYPVLELAD